MKIIKSLSTILNKHWSLFTLNRKNFVRKTSKNSFHELHIHDKNNQNFSFSFGKIEINRGLTQRLNCA